MKYRTFTSLLVGCCLLMSSLITASPSDKVGDDFYSGFRNPPTEARPRTWWHWINDNITHDGITKDLEAMKRVGLKGAQIFNIQQGGHNATYGDEYINSPSWLDAIEHAAKEAERIGLTLGMANAAGVSGAGGPWITPELSMQELVWRHAHIKDGFGGKIQLPQPQINHEYYRDIAVLAFPTIPGDATPISALNPKVRSSIQDLDWSAAIDGDDDTFVTIDIETARKGAYDVVFEFPEPITVRSLSLQMHEDSKRRSVKLSTSGDGITWKHFASVLRWRSEVEPIREEVINGYHARETQFVKLDFAAYNPPASMKIYELNFQSARLDNIHTKAARMRTQPQVSNPSTQSVPASQIIAADSILDLTDHLLPGGMLDVNLPAGDWTILRIGHTSNGNKIKPSTDKAKGLEVDKMSAEALAYHFNDGMIGQVADLLGPLMGKVMVGINVDSWESNCQTWTKEFAQEFEARRGYDLRKWLITITGRFVDSVDMTERFLWDYRRTVGDLISENFYGKFQALCNERGLLFEAEAPGIGMPVIMDQIQALGTLDVPQGEFWLSGEPHPIHGWKGGQDNTKEAATAGHVYGKPIISCEAFTSFGHHDGWTQYPEILKPVGDRQFCKGMNEIVFHRYVHQPDDRAPGMSLGQFGLNFDRHLTWWEQARSWMDYLARCQYMLREGRFHADVLYYYGEDVPNSAWYSVPGVLDPRQKMKPVLPQGYDYDVCDRTILDSMWVEDGVVVLASGMRYPYLVLPESARYTPAALEKVYELIMAGATVIGPKPDRSPSMNDYPHADGRIQELAAKIWPQATGPGERRVGKGRVIMGKSFETIFAEDDFGPDFVAHTTADDSEIYYIHRKIESGNIYFVSNQKNSAQEATLDFRVTGMIPELWDASTGEKSDALMYSDNGTMTSVSLRLENFASQFVIFRKPSTGKGSVVELIQNGKPLRSLANPVATPPELSPQVHGSSGADAQLVVWESGTYDALFKDGSQSRLTIDTVPAMETVQGSWQVSFQPSRGAPEGNVTFDELISWTDRPEDGIRHFSGTASYVKTITLDAQRLEKGRRVYLDLGEVKYLAEVLVNGEDLGVLWKAPYRVDITDAAKVGDNKVEIKLINLWKNRLIGDSKLPKEEKYTWSFYYFYKPDSPLMESGLIGPVRVLSSESLTLSEGSVTTVNSKVN